MQSGQRPSGADFEDRATVIVVVKAGRRAIEIGVAALDQPGGGICAILDAREGMQSSQRPSGADFEDRAVGHVDGAAVASCAIEIAVTALHQPAWKPAI